MKDHDIDIDNLKFTANWLREEEDSKLIEAIEKKRESTLICEELQEEFNSPSFKHGEAVGYSSGLYHLSTEAIKAYDNGEIDLWIEYQRPKSTEEWKEFQEKHGDLSKRWSPQKD